MNINCIVAFVTRHIYEVYASIDRKVDIFFWPTVDLFTFGFLTVYIGKLDVQPGVAEAMLGALIFWTLVYNMQRDIAFVLLEDAWSRNLYNLIATPIRLREIIAGTLLLSLAKALITAALTLTLAFWIFDLRLVKLGIYLAIFIFQVFVFAWAFGYFTSSLILRFGTKLQAFSWAFIEVLYPISGVFYPLETLPGFLAVLAKFLPVSYIFEGLRKIIVYQSLPDGQDLVVMTLLNIMYLVVGIWFFSLGFKHAKNRGWFVHPI